MCSVIGCGSVAIATMHDRRGCKDFCAAHALERLQQSFAFATTTSCSCGRIKAIKDAIRDKVRKP